MLALDPLIKTRLAALGSLQHWQVRGCTEEVDRSAVPAADIRLAAAQVGDSKAGAVTVQPGWGITLVTKRGATAAADLDAAVAAVIGAMQGWNPSKAADKPGMWSEFKLSGIEPPDFLREGLVGLELIFTTGGAYKAIAT